MIAAAGALEIAHLQAQVVSQPWAGLLLVAFFSALSALLCIRLFMQFVERVGMAPFALYRLVLGAALFLFVV